jgi:acyl carrier protein
MLTASHPPVLSAAAAAAVEARVLDIVAETSGWDRVAVEAASRLLDAPLDSLTSIAVITRIEAAFGVELAGDEALALLATRDFCGLARLVAGAMAQQPANLGEITGKESC